MAEVNQAPTGPSKAANRRRKVKEVATKLKNLPPKATAEVLEEVMPVEALKHVGGGFAHFLRDQGVVGIGIGLVFGIQIKAVVDTVMESFVNPITEVMLPGGLAKQTVILHLDGQKVEIGWGAIVYSLLTFIIVAFIIYGAYKLLKLDKLAPKKKDK